MPLKDELFKKKPQAAKTRPVVTAAPVAPPPGPVTYQPAPSGYYTQPPAGLSWQTVGLVVCMCVIVGLVFFMLRDGKGRGSDDTPEADGLHVLVVYEASPEEDPDGKGTRAQQAALASQPVRQWLKDNCTKCEDGKTPAYHILDEEAETDQLDPVFQELMRKRPKQVPWLYAFGGDGRDYSGPVPDGVEEFLKTVEAAK